MFEEDIPKDFKCDEEVTTGNCGSLLHLTCSLPDYLIQPAIQMSLQELGASKAVPADELDNANTNDKGLNER